LLLRTVPCAAQQVSSRNERGVLESRAARAESSATSYPSADGTREARRAEASALRARLLEGDFHPGDRITLWINGEPSLSNTFTVRAGNVLEIPSLPPISLRGVLRSELRDVLLTEIRRYIKEPEIQVTTLVNVTILGAVGRPGFYAVAPDAPITDILMTAGGPSANADLTRSHVVRNGADIVDEKGLRLQLEANKTIDEIGIQSGDQVVIGDRPHRWQTTSSVLGVFALLVPTVVLLFRR